MNRIVIVLFSMAFGTYGVFAQMPSDTIRTDTHEDTVFAIEGSVKDKSGEPVIGASVKLKERSGIYAVTDADGIFRISNIPGNCGTIQITYVGFIP